MYEFLSSPIAHWLAQLPQSGIETPEDAALIFSGPQFFIALLSGLVLAFGFQLLLTNLSIAAGISYVGHSSSSKSSGGVSPGRITVTVGIWTLITVSLALFFACWLAVKLSLYNSALLGAITGLVIWGTYFSLLFWVSSTTVGSLIGSVVRTATASFNSLVGTATAAFGAKAASNQVFETAEAVAAAVRKEIAQGFGEGDLLDSVQDYVATLRSPQLDTAELEREFETLIQTTDLEALTNADGLAQLDQQTFEDLVSSRTDLSRQEVERVAGRLYRIWQREISQTTGQSSLADLADYLRTARPEERVAEQVGDRLDQFLDAYRRRGQQSSSGMISQGLNTLSGALLANVNLSDLDVEKVATKIDQTRTALTGSNPSPLTASGAANQRYSVVRADVENYLLNTFPWQLQQERLEAQFRDVIYDTEASTTLLRQELQQLSRSDFVNILAGRGLLTPTEIEQTAAGLESVRLQVLREVIDIDRFEAAKALRSRVTVFLKETPKAELLADMGQDAFQSLIADDEASFDDLQVRFSEINTDFFAQTLNGRNDLDPAEVQLLVSRFEQQKNQTLSEAHSLQEQVKLKAEENWQQLQSYLRQTGRSELDPAGIKRDLTTMLKEPNVGVHRLRQRMAQFDRETLVQILNQRDDLSETDIRRILHEVETTWYQVIGTPAQLTAQAQAKLDEATSAIAAYLRRTGKPELNPEGIQRDLGLLMEQPQAGAEAIRARLAAMDRDTLVQLLSQRDDLSATEVNEIIDNIQQAIRNLVKAPQRLARRTRQQAASFQQGLEEYLRNTQKAELHPEGIKRDLRLLLNSPQLGAQRLGQRLNQIDRNTVVALLAQRPDMTQAEAEATVEQVLSVRDEIQQQLHQLQLRVQSLIDRLLARIKGYLNSLERPELDYDGIRRDLRTLFDDPQSGFEALKQRLARCDRNTLVAIVSSHDAISEADAHRVINQVESARDSALQKAERLEQEVERRVTVLKQEAQQQVDDMRKAAEAASWWLFATATISAIVAAIGGSLAVIS
ncbi:MAG: MFS transporter [Leptolyngbyaceae cyanobacterium]